MVFQGLLKTDINHVRIRKRFPMRLNANFSFSSNFDSFINYFPKTKADEC